jgi:acyl carrier protein
MNSAEIFEVMKTYVKRFNPEIDQAELGNQKVSEVLISSFDAVEFTMHLEDELGLEEETIRIEELAPKFEKLSFAELADEITQLLNEVHSDN